MRYEAFRIPPPGQEPSSIVPARGGKGKERSMEKTQKLEAAWWWARNARLAALRQKREEHGDPHNPLRALPGPAGGAWSTRALTTSLPKGVRVLLLFIAVLLSAMWVFPGHEAEFEAATELAQSMGVILGALEREITRARGEIELGSCPGRG